MVPSTQSNGQSLAASESHELLKYEAVIDRGLVSFMQVGDALAKIRDARLYRAQFGSFQEYCRERWHLGKSRAYGLISEASAALSVQGIGHQPNSRQAAELAKAPESARAEIWESVVNDHGDSSTAAHVAAEVLFYKHQHNPAGHDHQRALEWFEHNPEALTDGGDFLQEFEADHLPKLDGITAYLGLFEEARWVQLWPSQEHPGCYFVTHVRWFHGDDAGGIQSGTQRPIRLGRASLKWYLEGFYGLEHHGEWRPLQKAVLPLPAGAR